MHCYRSWGLDIRQRQPCTNAKAASCVGQRLCSWRGRRAPHAQRLVARRAGEPQDPYHMDKDEHGTSGSPEPNPEPFFLSPTNTSRDHDNDVAHPENFIIAALAGMAVESRDGLQSPTSRNSPLFTPEPSNPKGWYECHLFGVLQDAHIDTQAASHFFSQLANDDSLGLLGLDDLLHVARIADITGFTLPPVIAAQLQRLVHSTSPESAKSTSQQLLVTFSYDLPALLDVLHSLGVSPSTAWTDYALHVWLNGDAGRGGAGAGSAGAQLSASNVRTVVTLLEAIYIPNASSSTAAEPRPPPAPYTAVVPQQLYNGTWRWTAASSASPWDGAAVESGSGGGRGEAPAGASVRAWLDACLAALLDGGALALAHQREDLYGMLPHLVTAPSAAMVERLYGEAWQPYTRPNGAAAPEQIASMLWLIAASGAKLPPAIVQGELRALEAAILRIASSEPGNGGGGGGEGSSRSDSGRSSSSSSSSASSNLPASSSPDGAAAAAALNAAFSLPSAPGSSGSLGLEPTTPPPSPAPSPPPLLPDALLPPSFPPPPAPPSATSSRFAVSGGAGAGGRLSAYAAYLSLWAFHHYRYKPHPTPARVLAPALLAAVVGRVGGGGRGFRGAGGGLNPSQRCRVLRAMLMCFDSVPPEVLSRYDWSPLFLGWEGLGAGELLPLLQELGALARQRSNRRGGGGGGGGGVQQLLRLSHLAAHVIQLPGWPYRLAGVGLGAAVSSLASLLVVLGEDAAADGEADGAATGTSGSGGGSRDAKAAGLEEDEAARGAGPGGAAGPDSDAAGAGGSPDGGAVDDRCLKAILSSAFAQGVLSEWLSVVLPVIQDGVKQVTGDWGTAGRRSAALSAAGAGPQPWETLPQQPQPAQQLPYHLSHVSDAADSAARDAEPVRPWGSVAVAAASAADGVGRSAPSWRPPSAAESASGATAAAVAAPLPPPLTAADLMVALTALRDAASALDSRAHPALNRTLMWAMQRLGSRAGRCRMEPDMFASVPSMLVRLDALGWVDMPLEWAHSVVQHPDRDAAWFRRLSWPEALRAVLVSGQLVQRARAEVLRRHGAGAAAAAVSGTTTQDRQLGHLHQHQQSMPPSEVVSSSSASSWDQSWGGSRDMAASAPVMGAAEPRAPSKASALLTAAERLRNHLLNLLTVRAAASSGTQLRQLALTWQVYGLPYDREVLSATLGALVSAALAAAAAAAAGDRGVAAMTRGSVRDAVARLEMMCESQQVPREEVEPLFAALRLHDH